MVITSEETVSYNCYSDGSIQQITDSEVKQQQRTPGPLFGSSQNCENDCDISSNTQDTQNTQRGNKKHVANSVNTVGLHR